ncbi:PilW family protein [Pseudomonas sp. WHRI 8822A]|uniref:PilW family protein n=1 Tax=Pseudomonas sp. WHRI 8822A TaxID=3162568 RepID=UPI0032EAA105
MTAIRSEAGLSLVELMIALAISSFLILGITQVYIDNQRHYLFQQSQGGNLDSGRFASLLFEQYLSKAGYRRDPSVFTDTAFAQRPANADCMEFKDGATITGLSSANTTGFCIRYQPQVSNELDCQGEASDVVYDKVIPGMVASDKLMVAAFKFEPGPGTNLERGRLLCKSLNAKTPQFTEQVTGIADMRLDFGVTADTAAAQTTQYISQTAWTVSDKPIRSLRYSLLLASRAGQRDSDDAPVLLSNWLNLSPAATKTRIQNGDSRRVYQVVSTTRTIRNLMP